MSQPKYTDDVLEALRHHLFGASNDTDDTEGLVVKTEGSNPAPGPIGADVYLRDFVKRMFHPDYAQIEQHLPQPEDTQ